MNGAPPEFGGILREWLRREPVAPGPPPNGERCLRGTAGELNVQ